MDVQKKREAFVDALADALFRQKRPDFNDIKAIRDSCRALVSALEAEPKPKCYCSLYRNRCCDICTGTTGNERDVAEPKPGRSMEEELGPSAEELMNVSAGCLREMYRQERAAHEELRRRVERAISVLGPRLHGQGPTHDCNICRAIRILEGREP